MLKAAGCYACTKRLSSSVCHYFGFTVAPCAFALLPFCVLPVIASSSGYRYGQYHDGRKLSLITPNGVVFITVFRFPSNCFAISVRWSGRRKSAPQMGVFPHAIGIFPQSLRNIPYNSASGPLLGLGEEGAHEVLDATACAQACLAGRRVARLQQIRSSCSPAPISTIRGAPIRLFSVTDWDCDSDQSDDRNPDAKRE